MQKDQERKINDPSDGWIMYAIRIQHDLKVRANSIEQLAKERALWMEKIEIRLGNYEKSLENANKEIAGLKEKSSGQDQSIKTLQEENRQYGKDIQALRERIIALDGKKQE